VPRADGRCRLVVSVHVLAVFRCPETFPRRFVWLLRRAICHAVRRADRILTLSEAVAGELRERWPECAPRLRVAPPGARAGGAPGGDSVVAESGPARDGGPPYFLFVGTLEPRKNLRLLAEAYAVARRRRADLPELWIVGRRGWGADPRPALERAGARLLGVVDDTRLEQLYAGALAVVYPSLYEGFGLPALEAMARGAPVLVSDDPACAEAVGDAALVVPREDREAWAEALIRAATDEGLRAELAARGRRRAREFTWERTAARVLEVYRELGPC